MTERIRFDVFGRRMFVEPYEYGWRLFQESAEGKSVRVQDIVIPPEIDKSQLATFLDDMYHEYATAAHSRVFEVDDSIE